MLGGHTEVAPAVSAPLVVMTGVGKARRDRLFTAAGARPGDALVLTKAAGLEGSHILANDLRSELVGRVPDALLEEARGYAAELSVVPEARLAVDLGATAMHDPTEGGVVGAAWEMAEASGCGFRIEVASILVRPPTRAICDALGSTRCGSSPAARYSSRAVTATMVRGLLERGIPGSADRPDDRPRPPPGAPRRPPGRS